MKLMGLTFVAAMGIAAGLMLAGCGSSDSSASKSGTATDSAPAGSGPTGSAGGKPTVAFAQANSADPWRQVFDAETRAEADKHAGDFTFQEQAAEDDPAKQINQIDTMMLAGPKVLLVSPATEAVATATNKAFDAGTPVILLDRAVPGDKYTCLIGGDNVDIGRQAANYIVSRLGGKGTVLMIQGLGGATATTERKAGATEVFKKNPGIILIEGDDCKYQRQAAQNYMETFLQTRKPFDAVYAHNDEMAIGAYNAWESWSKSQSGAKKPIFVGVDGCQKETIEMIKAGKLDATFKYPIPGPRGIQVAADLLKGKKPDSPKIVLGTELITKATAEAYEATNPSLAK